MVLTPLARAAARATGHVAIPRDTRWHKKEIPLLGGVAIFIATTTAWAAGAAYAGWDVHGHPYLPLVLCAAGVFLVGLVDDISSLDPQSKLAAQLVIVSLFMVFGFRLGWAAPKTANLFLTVLWVVGITNAFNLLDNMDGLAAGVAFIAGIFLFLNHYMNPGLNSSSSPILVLTCAYLGALLGFLVYNFNPASIFMGDAGSLFIGFIMAGLTLSRAPEAASGLGVKHLLSVIAVPILILFIPILDTGFVSFMRKLFRRPISQGGRDHSSHRMVAIGFSERRAVLVLYFFSVLSGLLALAVNRLSIGVTLVLTAFYLLFLGFFWIYLARVKVYDEQSILSGSELGSITPLLIQLTYRRRLLEVLLDFILVTVTYYASYLLRFEGPVYYLIGEDFKFFLKSLPILLACQIFSFYIMGVYRGVWETTGLSDLIDYIKAITAGTVSAMLILLFLYRFESFSRAVFIIYWVLMLLVVSLSRLSFRLVDEGVKKSKQKGKPTLIYGAGRGGRMAAKEIESNPALGLVIEGFIDDNPDKWKKKIMGYPVLGSMEDFEEIIRKKGIRQVIVSFKNGGEETKRELRARCQQMDAEVAVSQMKLVLE